MENPQHMFSYSLPALSKVTGFSAYPAFPGRFPRMIGTVQDGIILYEVFKIAFRIECSWIHLTSSVIRYLLATNYNIKLVHFIGNHSQIFRMNKREDDPSVEQFDTIQSQEFNYEEKVVNVKGVDDALIFTVDREPITWTAEEERRLLWKIDLRLIPLVRQI